MIGYPRPDHVVIGGRGVLRARLHAHGIASHSGSRTTTPNAITKAAALVSALAAAELPASADPAFPLPPKMTVTEISGGNGYSAVPDLCILNVDVRLTPNLDATAAEALLRSLTADVDTAWPGTQPTRIQITTRWPPYKLPQRLAAEDSAAHRCAAGWALARPRSPGPPTSATTSPVLASRRPPDSASTRACTAPTNASVSIRSRPSRPPTTRHA
jgi:succinyl-diaminopimelate desuccinylase